MPELSIVIPVYNVEQWLPCCLDSIEAQTFKDWEAILIDDGSIDFSGIMCDARAKRDPRFKIIHQKNGGVSAARNAGISAATGSLLSFIDPDDFISHNYFEKLIESLHYANADIAQGSMRSVEENGSEGRYILANLIENRAKNRPFTMKDNTAVVNALCENLFSCVSWGRVFTRDIWGNARFPVGIDLGEDMMTVPPVIATAKAAVYTPKAVYNWRHRKRSLLHGTVTEERLIKDLIASQKMVERLTELHPNYKECFESLKLQYDIGCVSNYLISKGNRKAKAGTLFTLDRYYKEMGYDEDLLGVQTVQSRVPEFMEAINLAKKNGEENEIS